MQIFTTKREIEVKNASSIHVQLNETIQRID
jgi:hypothetical protein